MIAMQGLQARLYAMAIVLVRLPKAMNCLAAVEARTDQVLSTMDCPYSNDAAISTAWQQGNGS
jgi:hypothetical protein